MAQVWQYSPIVCLSPLMLKLSLWLVRWEGLMMCFIENSIILSTLANKSSHLSYILDCWVTSEISPHYQHIASCFLLLHLVILLTHTLSAYFSVSELVSVWCFLLVVIVSLYLITTHSCCCCSLLFYLSNLLFKLWLLVLMLKTSERWTLIAPCFIFSFSSTFLLILTMNSLFWKTHGHGIFLTLNFVCSL